MSFWTGQKTLVAGGSGFIGSHLVERLLNEGAHVRVAGRKRSRLEEKIGSKMSDVEFLEGDLRLPEFANTACQDRDTVFNLTAHVAGAGWNNSHPGTMFTENVALALPLLDGAVKIKILLCSILSPFKQYFRVGKSVRFRLGKPWTYLQPK